MNHRINHLFHIPVSRLLILFCFLLLPGLASAQAGLEARDLSGVRSNDISDAQLRMFLNRAEEEGYSVDEAFNLARVRGLPASQAQLLRQRIRDLDDDWYPDPEEERPVDRRWEETEEERLRELELERERERIEEERPPRREELEERRVFGSRVFREVRQTFAPSLNVPTPASYTIGPGDELRVDIWGEATNVHQLAVEKEGTVVLDDLGPIFVSGLTVEEVSQRIITSLQELYSGLKPGSDQQTTFARVTLDRLRTIQVSVVGEVHNPGSYEMNALATVFNALYRSGGPSFKGSYRVIRVFRNHELEAELDLYDFLVDGNQRNNIRLRDQDVIMIGPYHNRIDVRGEVKRTGYFELKDGETLADLMRFSGGFSENAYTRLLRIYRNTPSERRVINIDMEEHDDFEMMAGDMLFVDEILDRFENRVSITGAVWREGEFELKKEMTLMDLVRQADGLRPDAFPTRGIINRVGDDLTLQQVSFEPGRLIRDPEAYDIILKPEDEVVIQSIHDLKDEQTVNITGAVRRRGTFDYHEGMTLEDLILKAEGFRESASEARIELSRRIIGDANPERRGTRLAETRTFSVSRDLQLKEEDETFRLKPFDRIFVHDRPEYVEQKTVQIEGEVLYPGTYTLQDRNERISSLIQRAGGLTEEAYIPGARLTRHVSVIDRADVRFDFLAPDEMLMDTLELDMEPENGEEADGEEERIEVRRIGVNLQAVMDNPNSREDLRLMEGDVLRIPQELQTVRVAGAVMQEVEVRYREGLSLRSYVNMAGGYTENARSRRAYVIYANGDLDRRKRYLFGLITSTPDIEPGAEIIIPEKSPREGLATGEIIAISSTVVSMMATLSLAIDRIAN